MTNRLIPTLTAAVLLCALAACAPAPGPDATDEDGTVSSSAPVEDEGTDEDVEEAPAAPAAAAPDGCTLVTAELVQQYLGIDPGACEPITSWADGPAGLYSSITMAIDTTASAPMYMPREVCGGTFEGAVSVPGADYGYAVNGELCIVKGTIGVKTSALLDDGVTSVEDWQQLAVALLGRI